MGDGSQISIPSGSSSFFFSPDGTKLYQLNLEFEHQSGSFHQALVLYDADSGRREGQFQFESGIIIYSATWREGEIIAQSSFQSWRLNSRNLRLLATQNQNSKLVLPSIDLCPDGETLYWRIDKDNIGSKPHTWNFADRHTEKILWSDGPKFNGGAPSGFSVDGHIVLSAGGTPKGEVSARDVRTGKERWRLRGPQSSVLALAPGEGAVYEARPNGELWKWPR